MFQSLYHDHRLVRLPVDLMGCIECTGAREIINLSLLHAIVCMRACHGAIRFGDPLTLDQCVNLIASLSTCKVETAAARILVTRSNDMVPIRVVVGSLF